jgi:hypothetical protein
MFFLLLLLLLLASTAKTDEKGEPKERHGTPLISITQTAKPAGPGR